MDKLSPLTVLIPLLAAAGLVGAVAISTRLFLDVASMLVAVAVTVLCVLLLRDAGDGLVVEWLGGWEPRDGVAIGVGLAVDPIGAGLASFVALMFVMAFVFSYRYFAVVGPLFHTLMLVFLAGATGFCLTGDLFTLFVFFELVSVSAYALTAYDIEEEGPLTGTLSFAVSNSVGAFLILTGIALLYARTGALNMAQIGDALAGGPADALVIGALTMITVGFLTKAAVVPFHFWLADAYSVSPTPVCLLLSAAMSELGLYALARVYWTVFSGVLDDVASAVTAVLLVAGALTAVLGAVMCFAQRHLKRMLAFATVSHVGLFLIGIALLDPAALGGTAIYVMADGAVKAALFVGIGVVQHRYGSVSELALRHRCRDLPITAGLVIVGGLAMASLPPFGPFLGKAMIEEAAGAAGYGWVTAVFVLASALTAGAVLRSAGRIFFGWGRPDERSDEDFAVPADEADPELSYPHDRVPRTLTATMIALLAGGLALGLVPGLADDAVGAAARFVDRGAYAATVLEGRPTPAEAAAGAGASVVRTGGAAVQVPEPGLRDWLLAALTLAGALTLAAVALVRGRLRDLPHGAPGEALRAGLSGLRMLHSGHVGDYVTWLVVGTVTLGAAWAAGLG
jgi:multicomponent Na+:H+ antiporter subunit D